MSFRRRLALFFLLIVVAPMIVVAILVSEVADDSANGKTDAALAEDLELGQSRFESFQRDAREVGTEITEDPAVRAALAAGDAKAAARAAEELAESRGAETMVFTDPDGRVLASIAREPPFAEAIFRLERPSGAAVGRLVISMTSAEEYLGKVAELTGERAALVLPDDEITGALEVDPAEIPKPGETTDATVGDGQIRLAAIELPGSGGVALVLGSPADSGGFLASRPGIAVAVLAFILIALFAAWVVTRTLQSQVGSMLAAARRIGDGDFSGSVPVVGDDEMAGLATEFNEMRDRLSAQMDQLKRQRVEIESSVSRIGEAFASGLDREALLDVMIETTVGACDAEYGIVALSGRDGAEAETGTATDEMRDVALEAERAALRGGEGVRGDREGTFALSAPLGRMGAEGDPVGAMTVARAGRAFSTSEADVFYYLVGQAGASVENVALHELVSEQAVTDELTGLPNNRAFRDSIAKEAARAARFRHDLSLLILDIDDFKQVNDTYGHLQGDAVLRTIGKILDAESRGIDEPARYGGEEFVMALPETGAEGASELGERIRAAIAAEPVPLVDGDGEITVTASFGAATMPAVGRGVTELIAAADGALYEAKRAGKNRVMVAKGNGTGWRTDAQ